MITVIPAMLAAVLGDGATHTGATFMQTFHETLLWVADGSRLPVPSYLQTLPPARSFRETSQ